MLITLGIREVMNKINNQAPIGVFDSGMGGLTVMQEIMHSLPNEDIIYFGDIARLPYGTKSVATIRKFAEQTVQFLLNKKVKAIVIACNTISAIAAEEVKKIAGSHIPVIDVISAGSSDAVYGKHNKIGIIATPATINSNAYPLAIHKLNPSVQTVTQACALFVSLIEEGFIEHPATKLIAIDYLNSLKEQNIDALILGCTHYPLIKRIISEIMGNTVKIIDPAITTTLKLTEMLINHNLLNNQPKNGNYHYYVTDIPVKFQENGERFLAHKMTNIELVSID